MNKNKEWLTFCLIYETSDYRELFQKGRDKLGHEKNKDFDYTMFHHRNDTQNDRFDLIHIK